MISKMLDSIAEHFAMAAIDASEYRKMKVNGMTFDISAFRAEGLGHVSAMTACGFFGLMKMDTLIINPSEKDMPLFAYDRVHAMGNDTLIFELYDTLLNDADLSPIDAVKNKAVNLPDHDIGEHWYDSIKLPVSISKKGKKKYSAAFDRTALEYLNAYLDASKGAALCQSDAKQKKASVYVEGLLKNGGPSTDVFKKGIGAEMTAELFRRILFGTKK